MVAWGYEFYLLVLIACLLARAAPIDGISLGEKGDICIEKNQSELAANKLKREKVAQKKQWTLQGSVVQKPINASPRLKIKQGVFLYFTMLFNADMRQNFTLEGNPEKQK